LPAAGDRDRPTEAPVGLLAVGAAVAVAYIDNTDESQSIKPREWE